MLKKTLATAIALTSLTGSVAAYADTEVKLYTWRTQETPLWEAINEGDYLDGITVKTVLIQANYESKLNIDIQSNRPDIFQLKPGASILEPWIDAAVVDADLFDVSKMNGVIGNTGPDGKVYGIPSALQVQAILTNKLALTEAGINPEDQPKTLEELYQVFASLKENGTTPISIPGRTSWSMSQTTSEVFLAGAASDEFIEGLTTGESCFTDPQFVASLELAKEWLDEGYFNDDPLADDYTAMQTDMALGNSAMMIDGGWASGPASPVYQIAPELEGNIGFWPIPAAGGKFSGWPDGSYQLNENSDNWTQAKAVLDFATTQEFAELFAKHVGEVPSYAGEMNIADERVSAMANAVATKSASTQPMQSFNLNEGTPSYSTLIVAAYEDVLSGEATPKEAAKAIQKGLNSWAYVGKKNCR